MALFSKRIQNRKQNLIIWNIKDFELLFTYIHPFLASLSVLFKHKSLSFVNLGFFLLHISIFWLEHLYILPKIQRPGCTYSGAKLAFYSWNLSQKDPWFMKIHIQFNLIAVWSISPSILLIIAWRAPESGWSATELPVFLKIDPHTFGTCSKFQDNKETSM